MRRIIYFIKKYRYLLLFFLLETIAISLTIQYHSYHKSKFVNSANSISGFFLAKSNSFQEYFNLKKENQLLNEENVRLKNLLELNQLNNQSKQFTVIDTLSFFQKYDFNFAKIIKNDFTKRNNFLTLNKGQNQGIEEDMGVINGNGVIGVVKNVSKNYATVLSILNSNSGINVRLKNSNHFGTLVWNGKDYNISQITDIPRQAILKIGDTVITGGKSAIFPEGIPVGAIKDFLFENNQYQHINLELFNDMSAIGHVQVIKNLQKKEQLNLEQQTVNE